ncbi:MAG: hypothetical protein ACOYK9_06435, partial [Chlamydiia bacterium]
EAKRRLELLQQSGLVQGFNLGAILALLKVKPEILRETLNIETVKSDISFFTRSATKKTYLEKSTKAIERLIAECKGYSMDPEVRAGYMQYFMEQRIPYPYVVDLEILLGKTTVEEFTPDDQMINHLKSFDLSEERREIFLDNFAKVRGPGYREGICRLLQPRTAQAEKLIALRQKEAGLDELHDKTVLFAWCGVKEEIINDALTSDQKLKFAKTILKEKRALSDLTPLEIRNLLDLSLGLTAPKTVKSATRAQAPPAAQPHIGASEQEEGDSVSVAAGTNGIRSRPVSDLEEIRTPVSADSENVVCRRPHQDSAAFNSRTSPAKGARKEREMDEINTTSSVSSGSLGSHDIEVSQLGNGRSSADRSDLDAEGKRYDQISERDSGSLSVVSSAAEKHRRPSIDTEEKLGMDQRSPVSTPRSEMHPKEHEGLDSSRTERNSVESLHEDEVAPLAEGVKRFGRLVPPLGPNGTPGKSEAYGKNADDLVWELFKTSRVPDYKNTIEAATRDIQEKWILEFSKAHRKTNVRFETFVAEKLKQWDQVQRFVALHADGKNCSEEELKKITEDFYLNGKKFNFTSQYAQTYERINFETLNTLESFKGLQSKQIQESFKEVDYPDDMLNSVNKVFGDRLKSDGKQILKAILEGPQTKDRVKVLFDQAPHKKAFLEKLGRLADVAEKHNLAKSESHVLAEEIVQSLENPQK